MTTFREELIDRIARLYGLEAPETVEFATLCEAYEDEDWCEVRLFSIAELLEMQYAEAQREAVTKVTADAVANCQNILIVCHGRRRKLLANIVPKRGTIVSYKGVLSDLRYAIITL